MLTQDKALVQHYHLMGQTIWRHARQDWAFPSIAATGLMNAQAR